MVEQFVRVTCDRCKRHADFPTEAHAGEKGWTNLVHGITENFKRATLCPDCSKVQEMVDEAFMKNTRFGLCSDSRKTPGWYISN